MSIYTVIIIGTYMYTNVTSQHLNDSYHVPNPIAALDIKDKTTTGWYHFFKGRIRKY